MADPVYGPGGTGYYTDPATGKRVWQTRYEYGANAYNPNDPSVLVYDPSNVSTTGSGTPTTGATYRPSDLTSGQQSAKAILTDALTQAGLSALADQAWQWMLDGMPKEQVWIEIRKTDQYKQRYPGMAELQSKGRAITEGQYIDLERSYVSLYRQAGLPAGFYDQPADFGSLIGGDVSPQELGARLDEYKTLTYTLPPQVRDEFGRLYGMSAGDITAYIIDPTRALPIIHNQFLAAQAGAGANQAGYGNISRSEAEQLGLTGVDYGKALQGFGSLVNEQQLFTPLVGNAGENAITRDEQLGAQFGGNANAQRRIDQRARQRVATFQEGGGYQKGGFGKAAS